MNRSFEAGRLSAKYCWRIGGPHRLGCLQKRHYADRYSFHDLTQSRMEAVYQAPSDVDLPRENPWRNNHPKNLNDIGYESHCNDRLYMAKNKYRQSLQEYDQKRQERRLESQKRIQKHFDSDSASENVEARKVSIMQDLAEHQKRQEDIIEMNRRQWHSRPQVKREINLSGITYRPDHHKHLMAKAHQKKQDSDHRRDSRERSHVANDAEAEAESNWWVKKQMGQEAETKAEAEESAFQRRMKRLMGRLNTHPSWRTNRPMAEAEKESRAEAEDNYWIRKQRREAEAEEDWRTGGQAGGSPLQRRLMELMEAENKPEAEEDWRVKSPKAEAEEEDWRVKRPRGEAEEEDWRVKRPRGEAEEEDWRVRSRRPEAEEEDWRVKSPRAEEDWRLKSRRPEAEEEDWRVKRPRGEAEEEDWRVRSRRPEAEEEDWRVKSPRAEDWRLKSRRPEAEEEDWRVKTPRAEAEEEDWRLKGWRSRQLQSSGLQKRLMELMEAEKKPEAEEEDWRTQSPEAEAEDSPRSEAEAQEDARDKDWKARNLSLVYDPNRPGKSWQEKRDQEVESQYWHSWHTCPGSQDGETTVELKPHPRRKRVMVHPPSYTRDGQRRSYHQTALNPQPMEVQPEPMANAPLMPKPLRAIPNKEKKSKPKRKRVRKSVEPPRFKMTIRSRPLVARRPTPVPSYLRRLNLLSEVAGPSFHMANLDKTLLSGNYAG